MILFLAFWRGNKTIAVNTFSRRVVLKYTIFGRSYHYKYSYTSSKIWACGRLFWSIANSPSMLHQSIDIEPIQQANEFITLELMCHKSDRCVKV